MHKVYDTNVQVARCSIVVVLTIIVIWQLWLDTVDCAPITQHGVWRTNQRQELFCLIYHDYTVACSFFQGLFMSTVRCMVCSKESRTFDTFSNLTLPLPPNASRCTLQVCVLINVKVEQSLHSSQVAHQVIAFYTDIIFLPHKHLQKPREHSLPFVCLHPDQGCRLCPKDWPEIMPISASLLCNKKLTINWTDSHQHHHFRKSAL